MSKIKEIYRTATTDYPGLGGVTASVISYAIMVVTLMLVVYNPFQWIFVFITLLFIAFVGKHWVNAYQHWKEHNVRDTSKQSLGKN